MKWDECHVCNKQVPATYGVVSIAIGKGGWQSCIYKCKDCDVEWSYKGGQRWIGVGGWSGGSDGLPEWIPLGCLMIWEEKEL